MNKRASFDYSNCIGGLMLNANLLHNVFYDFCLFLTFKKSLKRYDYDLNELHNDVLIRDADFFNAVNDPFVKQSYISMGIGCDLESAIELRHGLDVEEAMANEEFTNAANRYDFSLRWDLINKPYSRVLFHYTYFYDSALLSLYYHACALSIGSYDIPLSMRTRIDYSFAGSFRALDPGNSDVVMVLEAMEQLVADQQKVAGLVKEMRPYMSCPKV